MLNILIAGAGGIGMRHIESLLKSNKLQEISILEKYESQIKKTKVFLKNKNKNKIKIKYFKNVNDLFRLNKSFFLVIVSTTADVR
jgi:FlaA1/EpsC-like NDP-sugar epimerase